MYTRVSGVSVNKLKLNSELNQLYVPLIENKKAEEMREENARNKLDSVTEGGEVEADAEPPHNQEVKPPPVVKHVVKHVIKPAAPIEVEVAVGGSTPSPPDSPSAVWYHSLVHFSTST